MLLKYTNLDENSRNLCQDMSDNNEKLKKTFQKKKDMYYKKFLWTVNKKLSLIENIQEHTFTYYLENPEELVGFSKLSCEDQAFVITCIKDRTITSNINVTSKIDITVASKNGISIINQITQMIKDNVDGFYYQDPPHYKLMMRRDNDDECRKVFASLEGKIKKLSEENDWKVVVHYDPKDEEITERSIKLRPLYRDKKMY